MFNFGGGVQSARRRHRNVRLESSLPEETRQRAKKPSENGVIVLLVGGIQGIPDLKVRHVPEPTNRSHCETDLPDRREDLTEIRLLLKRLASVVIYPDTSPSSA